MTDFENFPVFTVATANRSSKDAGVANAVLVDKKRGLFVTNAHVVDPFGKFASTEHYIHLPHTGKFHRAVANERWNDWNCDRGYLRLLDDDLSPYQEAEFIKHNIRRLDPVSVIGIPEQKDGRLTGAKIKIDGVMVLAKSRYGACSASADERDEVSPKRFRSNFDKKTQYENYILMLAHKAPRWPTLSGSALVDEHGRLAGILSIAGGRLAQAFPLSEIRPDRLVLDDPPAPPPNQLVTDATPAPGKGFFSWLKRPAAPASDRRLG